MNMLRAFIIVALLAALSINSAPANTTELDRFACEFEISQGQYSRRYFALSKEVYACLRHPDYSDMVLLNARGREVSFRLSSPTTRAVLSRHQERLTFTLEPSQQAFKTAAQIRRISQLTGVVAGGESEGQWQQKNAYYASLIIDRLQASAVKKDKAFDRLTALHIGLDGALLESQTPKSINAIVMLEASDDLQNWRTVVGPRSLIYLMGSEQNEIKIQGVTKARYLRIATMSHVAGFGKSITAIKAEYQRYSQQPPILHWLAADQPAFNPQLEHWEYTASMLVPVSRIRMRPNSDIAIYQGRYRAQRYVSPVKQANENIRHRESGKDKLKRLAKDAVKGRRSKSPGTIWEARRRFYQYQLRTENGLLSSSDISLAATFSQHWGFDFMEPSEIAADELPYVEFGWYPQNLMFTAQGQGPFRLLVGADDPVVKTNAAVNAGLRFSVNEAEQVSVTPADPRNSDEKRRLTSSGVENSNSQAEEASTSYKTILLILLGVGVLIMGMMAFRLSKSMQR